MSIPIDKQIPEGVEYEILENLFIPDEGKYVSTDDPNWAWEFKSDGKLYDYYEGESIGVYHYSIEKTSPQCGFEVDEGPLFEYFTRTDINNPSEKFCYEIYGLEDGILQLRYLGTNSFLNFKKINCILKSLFGQISPIRRGFLIFPQTLLADYSKTTPTYP